MLHAAVTYKGEEALYQLLSVVDCSSTITAGREIYGQPYKFGYPSLVCIPTAQTLHLTAFLMPFSMIVCG